MAKARVEDPGSKEFQAVKPMVYNTWLSDRHRDIGADTRGLLLLTYNGIVVTRSSVRNNEALSALHQVKQRTLCTKQFLPVETFTQKVICIKSVWQLSGRGGWVLPLPTA